MDTVALVRKTSGLTRFDGEMTHAASRLAVPEAPRVTTAKGPKGFLARVRPKRNRAVARFPGYCVTLLKPRMSIEQSAASLVQQWFKKSKIQSCRHRIAMLCPERPVWITQTGSRLAKGRCRPMAVLQGVHRLNPALVRPDSA